LKPGQLPPWPWQDALTPEKEVILGRETSERPLHGVPSVWRDPYLEWCVNWFDGKFYIFQNLPVPEGVALRDKRVALIFENIAPLADVIGFYTRHLRFDTFREGAILRILHVAEWPVHYFAEDYGTRAWMHRVCLEARKR
jgi:hypothetical protein